VGNHLLKGIVLKEFQFGDFIFLMWCSYLGELHNNVLYHIKCILENISELWKEVSFEDRLNLWPHEVLLVQLQGKMLSYVIIDGKERYEERVPKYLLWIAHVISIDK